MKRYIQRIFFGLVIIALAQATWHYQRLPERVATHFALTGEADGWMPRGEHMAFQVGTVTFVAVFLLGLARFSHKLPDHFINLPHREHWLAPKNRAATFDWLAGMLLGLGSVLLLFFIALFQMLFEANLAPVPRLALQPLPFFAGLFVFFTALVVLLMFRFRRPPTEPGKRRR
jgi:uncharacterized membrane protein